jgi:hypothetical protein
MVTHFYFSYLEALPTSEYRDVAMELPIEFDFFNYFSSIALESTVEIVNAHPGEKRAHKIK